jgi:hypothetical protein
MPSAVGQIRPGFAARFIVAVTHRYVPSLLQSVILFYSLKEYLSESVCKSLKINGENINTER